MHSQTKQQSNTLEAGAIPLAFPPREGAPGRVICPPVAATHPTFITQPKSFPQHLSVVLDVFLGQDGKAYATMQEAPNAYALAVGSRLLNNEVRRLAHEANFALRRNDLHDLNDHLKAHAEMSGKRRNVCYRVASIPDGIEIDIGDSHHTHVRVTPGNVEIVPAGSDTLFFRTPSSLAMVLPAEEGNLGLLNKYLNMSDLSKVLFIAWLSYTLAHPKIATSKFPILVLQGNQGTGKTSLCNNVIIKLIDPSSIGVQLLPTNPKDLAIAAQNSHVLCYDNIRAFRQSMADNLCVAATGGSITARQLYSDADQHVLNLHVALVLNGIHSFIDQPDLAQRCLPIELLPIPEEKRKPEAELMQEFQSDLPAIMRGLLDLIANVLAQLPSAEVTNPERMIDFVRWLAAMEKVAGIPAGIYQGAYSMTLQQGQLDSLLDDILAASLVEFVEEVVKDEWFGTPAKLLTALNRHASTSTQRSREWPQNPISLSKRLKPLQAALLSQGVRIEFGRGKERVITITVWEK